MQPKKLTTLPRSSVREEIVKSALLYALFSISGFPERRKTSNLPVAVFSVSPVFFGTKLLSYMINFHLGFFWCSLVFASHFPPAFHSAFRTFAPGKVVPAFTTEEWMFLVRANYSHPKPIIFTKPICIKDMAQFWYNFRLGPQDPGWESTDLPATHESTGVRSTCGMFWFLTWFRGYRQCI